MNALSFATAFASAAILLLGIVVLARGGRLGAIRLFFVVTLAHSAWLAAWAAMYASQDARDALTWARSGFLFGALIPPAVFHFTTSVAGASRPAVRRLVVVAWALCAAVGLIGYVTPVFVASVHRFDWGFYPTARTAGAVAMVLFAAVIAASLHTLVRMYRESTGKSRERAAALLLALALGSLAMLDYLPSVHVDLQPIGYIAALAFVIVTATAAWRFELAQITPEYAAGQILETMKSAVIVSDMGGRIRVANRAAERLLGFGPDALHGVRIREVLQGQDGDTTEQLLSSTGVFENSMVWYAADGAAVDVMAASSFVRDEEGVPVGVVYVASDYTERKRADQALRDSETRYRTLFQMNPLPMWVYELETLAFTAVNDAAVRHYGFTRDEFMRMKISDIRPVEEIPAMLEALAQLESRSGPTQFRHRKKDGTVIDVEITSFEFASGKGRSRLVISQDITERKRAEKELRRSEERYRELFEDATANEARYRLLFERNLAGVYRTDARGKVLDGNDACARIFGYASREEFLTADAHDFYFEGSERDRMVQMLRDQKQLSNLELRLRRRDGATIWVLENVTLLDNEILEGTVIDITARKHAEEQMEYQAYHDALTGLPNRLLFRDRISVALAHARRNARVSAVMFLDLDQFKLVNDTLGHTIGDRLLQVVAWRLVSCVRAEDTVARMGGDEFTILLADLNDRRGATAVAQKILDAVRQPVLLDEHELYVTTSIGIAVFTEDGHDAEALLKNADRAMYRAKAAGRDNFQFATEHPLETADRGASSSPSSGTTV